MGTRKRLYWMLNSIVLSLKILYKYISLQSLSCVQLFVTPWTAVYQASCPKQTPRVYPNSCPLTWWCHPTISFSVVPISSCLQSFPTSRSFQMSQFFTLGGQSIGVSASTSVLPMNTQDGHFHLEVVLRFSCASEDSTLCWWIFVWPGNCVTSPPHLTLIVSE